MSRFAFEMMANRVGTSKLNATRPRCPTRRLWRIPIVIAVVSSGDDGTTDGATE
jgi:hypothetical protein